jgi:HEAT repeat protein
MLKRDPRERSLAMDVLLAHADEIETTLRDARRELSKGEDEVRLKAAQIIARIGPGAGGTGTDLIRAIEIEKSGRVRAEQTWALGRLFWHGCNPREAKAGIPVLIRLMQKDDDHLVRVYACRSFLSIGPLAKDAAPALLEIIRSKDDTGLGEEACVSLTSVVCPGSNAIVPALLQTYKESRFTNVKSSMLLALGIIGDKEDVVVPLLVEVLKDSKHPELRLGAAAGLVGFGPRAKAAVPALVEALEAGDIGERNAALSVRWKVLEALGSIGPDARAAIPAITKASSDPSCSIEANRAIKLIEKK